MKLINPFNLIMWVVIYVVTVWYFRETPLVGKSRVGWGAEEGTHGVLYNPVTGRILVLNESRNPSTPTGYAEPDGTIKAWFGTPRVYLTLAHGVLGDYLADLRGHDHARKDPDDSK